MCISTSALVGGPVGSFGSTDVLGGLVGVDGL